jgi:ADP-heptose:LPS heptosyltransferase
MPERFLVVRLGSLGDIVHTFPAVAGLRQSFPDSGIVWLTHPRWESLVESSGLASEIWTIETRAFSSLRETLRRIRTGRWDAAIDYQGLWKSAALPFLGGIKRRIGFSSKNIREFAVPILYNERVRCSSTHIADQNGELSLRAGAHDAVANFHLNVSHEDEAVVRVRFQKSGLDRYVVLSPGGGWRSKCWPAERFGSLCRMIHDSFGVRSIINYGPGEDDLVAATLASSGDADPVPYNGALGQLMAVLRHAICVVGGDTGPLHLAVALGARVVALFGPTDPARNGPYRCGHPAELKTGQDIVIRSPNGHTTYKRGGGPDPSMLEISVEAAFDAVKRCVVGAST